MPDKITATSELVETPTVMGLIGRLCAYIAVGAACGSGTIIIFYRYTLQTTLADQRIISGKGWPVMFGGTLLFLFLVFYLSRSLIRFTIDISKNNKIDEAELLKIQGDALNLGLKMAIMAVIFYIVIVPLNLMMSYNALGWPPSTVWYGFFAGIIASLILAPIALNASNWAVAPILDFTVNQIEGHDCSRRVGWRFNLGFKLMATFLPLIAAALIFASMIGYSQTQNILENMSKMQDTFVSAPERGQLADEIEHISDPRIRSADFFKTRLGGVKYFYIVLVVGALGMGLLMTAFYASQITKPMKTLIAASNRVKDGNVEEAVRMATNDEFSELGASINQMMTTIVRQIKSMSGIVENLRYGIVQLDDTISAVLAISADQSTGACQQSAATQQSSSIAAEIQATSQQIGVRSSDMEGVAKQTLKACADGENKLDAARIVFAGIAEQAESSLLAMKELEGKFQDIFKTVENIEDIADQTEMLALNAALEAAGAGVEGKRFAVVADSTRRLALRAGRSSKEIRTLVETVRAATLQNTQMAEMGKTKVSEGWKAIENTVEAFKAISTLANLTSNAVSEINISTNQQTSASEQLAAAISEVHEVAKKAENGAKEIESVINKLRTFAENLLVIVEKENKII